MLLPGQQDEAAFHAAGGKPVMELNGFIGENDFVVEALHMGHGRIIRACLQKRGNRRARPVFFQPFPRLDGLHIAGAEKLPVQPPGQIHRAVKIDNIIGPGQRIGHDGGRAQAQGQMPACGFAADADFFRQKAQPGRVLP